MSWGLAFGLILKEKSSWWNDNPSGVITASLKTKWHNILIEEHCSIAAFVDGSWKQNGQFSTGGIGGLVKSTDGVHILEFAGPVLANSALHSEKLAFIQLIALLENSKWMSERILILSNSSQLIELLKVQYISPDWEKLKEKVSLRHISRVFNTQPDSLVKQGAYLNHLWFRWAS